MGSLKWRIHYEDAVTFSNLDGSPSQAPKFGVLAIWQANPEAPLYNKDYYIWRDDYDCWIEVDLIGLLDHLTSACEYVSVVLIGRCVPTARYRDTLAVLREVNA